MSRILFKILHSFLKLMAERDCKGKIKGGISWILIILDLDRDHVISFQPIPKFLFSFTVPLMTFLSGYQTFIIELWSIIDLLIYDPIVKSSNLKLNLETIRSAGTWASARQTDRNNKIIYSFQSLNRFCFKKCSVYTIYIH